MGGKGSWPVVLDQNKWRLWIMDGQDNTELYSFLNLDWRPPEQKSDEPELKNTMANSIDTGHTVDVTAVRCMLHWPAYAATLKQKE